MIEINTSEVFSPIDAVRDIILIVFCCALGITLVASYLFSFFFTQPLRQLHGAIFALSQGDISTVDQLTGYVVLYKKAPLTQNTVCVYVNDSLGPTKSVLYGYGIVGKMRSQI